MAKKDLCEEYERLSLECKELRNQLREKEIKSSSLWVKIDDHDKFRINLIGEALATLITEVSGRKFIYDEVDNTYYEKRLLSAEFYDDYEYRRVKSVANIVVACEEYKKEYYSETTKNKVFQLVKKGDAILLKPYLPYVNYVSIYQGCTFDGEKFGYVKDFIKALIGYCCWKNIKYGEATKEDINECLKKFLNDNKAKYTQKNPSLKLTK